MAAYHSSGPTICDRSMPLFCASIVQDYTMISFFLILLLFFSSFLPNRQPTDGLLSKADIISYICNKKFSSFGCLVDLNMTAYYNLSCLQGCSDLASSASKKEQKRKKERTNERRRPGCSPSAATTSPGHQRHKVTPLLTFFRLLFSV